MARLFVTVCCLLVSVFTLAQSQPTHVALAGKTHSLDQRYYLMKSNSQTYQDYKVIKEFVLEGFWKIVMDSVGEQRKLLAQAQQQITQLKVSLQSAENTLQREREASAQVVHDSTHVGLLGFDMRKSSFLSLVTFVFAGFIGVIGLMAGRMKLMAVHTKEKVVVADIISHEFEDFKRRSLEKQTKLSRELQNERNKIEELKAQFK